MTIGRGYPHGMPDFVPAESPPESSLLRSFDPATGNVVRQFRANTAGEVRDAVARARAAAPAWAALGPTDRAKAMAEVRHEIHRRMDDLVNVISRETGKPRAEAMSHDVLPSLLTIAYLSAVAPRALRPTHPGRLLGPILATRSRIEWRPFGVVGAITPWNYPLFLSVMAIAPALLAGNAVVLKPSEITPGVGALMAEVLSVLPRGVCEVVLGGGDIGAALVDAPCDKVCFVGSAATGRRISQAAANHLTPVVMELGGQDAAIVCADADVDVTASGVLWGAFLNCGQTCAAIERVYVVGTIADEFERVLLDKLSRVAAGPGSVHPDIGPLTAERQFDVVERHVADAVGKGARVLAGGGGVGIRAKDGSLWFAPTVLEGRSNDMALFREETFGPVLPIVRVRDEGEAIRRANEDGCNLTASVWSRDSRRAEELASRLVAGTVTVNDHASTAAVPWGLWGGIHESGYGRLQGELGLREFCAPVHVATNMVPRLKRLWWYPYDEATNAALRAFAVMLSAPTLSEKGAAARTLVVNVARSIRSKI